MEILFLHFQRDKIIASTHDVECAGYYIENESTYAIQFHPEVYHSTDGEILLKNFFKLTFVAALRTGLSASFVEKTVAALKEKLGNDKVVLGLSGGVDSTVTAVLLHKAIVEFTLCVCR